MAKIVVQNDTNADIGIVLERDEQLRDWVGECTQCGFLVIGLRETAVTMAVNHVDTHDGEE